VLVADELDPLEAGVAFKIGKELLLIQVVIADSIESFKVLSDELLNGTSLKIIEVYSRMVERKEPRIHGEACLDTWLLRGNKHSRNAAKAVSRDGKLIKVK
jgi:hypothetical protein